MKRKTARQWLNAKESLEKSIDYCRKEINRLEESEAYTEYPDMFDDFVYFNTKLVEVLNMFEHRFEDAEEELNKKKAG